MIARGVTREQLETAAQTVGVRLANGMGNYQGPAYKRTLRDGREEWTFTLKTAHLEPDWPKTRAPYRRHSQYRTRTDGSYSTIPGAVCWHGHRDFFRALFDLAPNAEVRTAKAVYKGREHFEATFEATGDACFCILDEETGEGYRAGREEDSVKTNTRRAKGDLRFLLRRMESEVNRLADQVRRDLVIPACRRLKAEFHSGMGDWAFYVKDEPIWDDPANKYGLRALISLLESEVWHRDHELGHFVSTVRKEDYES